MSTTQHLELGYRHHLSGARELPACCALATSAADIYSDGGFSFTVSYRDSLRILSFIIMRIAMRIRYSKQSLVCIGFVSGLFEVDLQHVLYAY